MTFRGHGGIAWEVTPGTGPSGPPGDVFITVAYPSGIAADDIIILLCPQGIFDAELPDWTPAAPISTLDGQPAHALWWKIADGTETGTETLEVAQDVITTSSQEVVASAIMFAYEDVPNDSTVLSFRAGGPLVATFSAQTGQQGDISIVVGFAFADSFSSPGGTNPSSVVDADLTVDARVSGSQDYTGPVTGDQTAYIEYVAASRAVTTGAVPQIDMSATDEFDARWWQSRNAGNVAVSTDEAYWGILAVEQ